MFLFSEEELSFPNIDLDGLQSLVTTFETTASDAYNGHLQAIHATGEIGGPYWLGAAANEAHAVLQTLTQDIAQTATACTAASSALQELIDTLTSAMEQHAVAAAEAADIEQQYSNAVAASTSVVTTALLDYAAAEDAVPVRAQLSQSIELAQYALASAANQFAGITGLQHMPVGAGGKSLVSPLQAIGLQADLNANRLTAAQVGSILLAGTVLSDEEYQTTIDLINDEHDPDSTVLWKWLIILGDGQLQSGKPGGTRTYLNWTFPTTPITSLQQSVTLEGAVPSDYYLQFYNSSIGNTPIYYGVQTSGLVLFDVWGTKKAQFTPNGNAFVTSGNEGKGAGGEYTSLRVQLPPLTAGTYTMSVQQLSTSKTGATYGIYAEVPDQASPIFLGSVNIPNTPDGSAPTISPQGGTFTEYWPNNSDPSKVAPPLTAQYSTPSANGGTIAPLQVTATYSSQPDSQQSYDPTTGVTTTTIGPQVIRTTPDTELPVQARSA